MQPGSEAHFRQTLGAERASALLTCLRVGATDAVAVVARENLQLSLTQSQIAFDRSYNELLDAFETDESVQARSARGQILWVLADVYGIRIKKLEAGYKPNNAPSRQQDIISAQGTLDGMPDLVFVTAGTRYSTRTGLPIEHVVVKHHPGKTRNLEVEWVIDLEELASGELGPVAPRLIDLPPTPAAEVRSRRKHARDEASGA